MTSDTAVDVREVIFINPDAESGYEGLPAGVGEEADGALTALQNGRLPARKGLWRMLKGKLGGIGEVRINDSTNTYRVYVWLGCDPAIYVLDAGMKKSPTGSDSAMAAGSACGPARPGSQALRRHQGRAAEGVREAGRTAATARAGECTMSETRAYDGDNWRDNPDEYKAPVCRGGSFLTSRGYENAEIAAVKFGLAEEIGRAVKRIGSPTQAEVASRVRAAGVPLSQPDVSAILNGRVQAFALERLMQVAAALGTTVTVSAVAAKDGVGHVQVRGRPTRRADGQPATRAAAAS